MNAPTAANKEHTIKLVLAPKSASNFKITPKMTVTIIMLNVQRILIILLVLSCGQIVIGNSIRGDSGSNPKEMDSVTGEDTMYHKAAIPNFPIITAHVGRGPSYLLNISRLSSISLSSPSWVPANPAAVG